jgi:hypothetical protein
MPDAVPAPPAVANRFRALLVRWERKAANYHPLVLLACCLIAIQQAE